MSEVTTDHDRIRKWAEAKGGKPAAVDRARRDGDVGVIRIMFPKSPHSEHENLVEISWDEFFKSSKKENWLSSTTKTACSSKSWDATRLSGATPGTIRPPGPHITLGARAAGPATRQTLNRNGGTISEGARIPR